MTERWQGHQVDVLLASMQEAGGEVLTYGTQIPLVPPAIQLIVRGGQSRSSFSLCSGGCFPR